MGAKVSGAGSDTIRIEGVSRLHGARYRIMPGRIDLCAAAVTGGRVRLTGTQASSLDAVIGKLTALGAKVQRVR